MLAITRCSLGWQWQTDQSDFRDHYRRIAIVISEIRRRVLRRLESEGLEAKNRASGGERLHQTPC
jgi:hypothetical protein